MWEESAQLAIALINANRMFATGHPAAMSDAMSNTDSTPFMNHVAAVSVRENRRRFEIGRGSDPHWHQPTDVLETFTDADYRLGFSAMETTLGATAGLAGARIMSLRSRDPAAWAELDPAVARGRARMVHMRAIPTDTHVDIDPSHFTPNQPNYVSGLADTQVDLPSMELGGLDAVFFSLFQAQRDDFTPAAYVQAVESRAGAVPLGYAASSTLPLRSGKGTLRPPFALAGAS